MTAMIFRAPPQFGQRSMSMIENALEQARTTHARRRRVRVGMIGQVGLVLRSCRNDLGTQSGVWGKHAVEADQMQARTPNECGESLHELVRIFSAANSMLKNQLHRLSVRHAIDRKITDINTGNG